MSDLVQIWRFMTRFGLADDPSLNRSIVDRQLHEKAPPLPFQRDNAFAVPKPKDAADLIRRFRRKQDCIRRKSCLLEGRTDAWGRSLIAFGRIVGIGQAVPNRFPTPALTRKNPSVAFRAPPITAPMLLRSEMRPITVIMPMKYAGTLKISFRTENFYTRGILCNKALGLCKR